MNRRRVCIILAVMLCATLAAGAKTTLAYMTVKSETLVNTFTAPELPPVAEPTPEGTPAPTEAPDLPQTGDDTAGLPVYAAALALCCAGAALMKRRARP